MGGPCSTQETYEKVSGRDHSENLGVGKRIILKWIVQK